jgi:methyl-accepting chemotaxis protein
MCVQAVENGAYQAWEIFKPYVVPVATLAGTALLVSQVWGNVFAFGFVGLVTAAAFAFPHVIDYLSMDHIVATAMRQVLVISMVFFGPLGIAGAVALSTAFALMKDVRLIECTAKLDRIETKMVRAREELQRQINQASQRIAQFNQNAGEIAERLARLSLLQEQITQINGLLEQLQQKRDELNAVLHDESIQREEVRRRVSEINTQVTQLSVNVGRLDTNYQALRRDVDNAIAQENGRRNHANV